MCKTTIYLVRHAHKSNSVQYLSSSDENSIDRLRPLSVKGIQQAENIAKLHCFQGVNVIYSSEYSRAIMTALFLAESCGCQIQVREAFNERLRRKNALVQMPDDFRLKQMRDINYKIGGGESRREVFERFYGGIANILREHRGQTIAIFTHKTAITMFLMNWCDYYIKEDVHLSYNNQVVFSGKWNGSPEIFKMEFNHSIVTDILKVDNLC